MRQLIAGNWKMHCLAAEAVALAAALARRRAAGRHVRPARLPDRPARRRGRPDAGKAPPSRSAGRTATRRSRAPTPATSPRPMLRDAGATWVILGHSERRQNHGETDELVREKTLAAVEAGLTPIVCVGETADQRSRRAGDRGRRLAARRQPAEAIHRRGGLRAGLGDRHRQDRHRGRRRHHACLHPRGAGAPVRRGRAGIASCMAARSNRPTPPPCWPCPRSAARWSAAPA